MAILAVNAGSSSLKFSMYPLELGQVQPSVLSGTIQGLEPGGIPEMGWKFQGHSERKPLLPVGDTDYVAVKDPFSQALQSLRRLLLAVPELPRIEAVAHRVVHGGQLFRSSVVVTDDILQQLSALDSLAPLHQPHNVEGIRAFRSAFAGIAQVA